MSRHPLPLAAVLAAFPLVVMVASAAVADRVSVETSTVSSLPVSCKPGQPFIVTDGNAPGDCTAGGGTDEVVCVCNADASSYSAAGDGPGTSLASTNLWVGNGSGVAAAVAMSGDATMDNAGVVTVTGVQSGADPTVTASGDIGIDTTNLQLLVGDGSNERVLDQDVKSGCATIESLAAADDDKTFPIDSVSGITVVSAYCHCQGTCTTEADLTWEYVEVGTVGPTVTAITGTTTCEDYVTGDTPVTFSGNVTIPALDVLRFDVSNAVSPETDEYAICVRYRLTGS